MEASDNNKHNTKRNKRLWLPIYLISLYLGASMTVYRLRHPELTSTQAFYNFKDAILWR